MTITVGTKPLIHVRTILNSSMSLIYDSVF